MATVKRYYIMPSKKLDFKTGQYVVYPTQGVGKLLRIEEQTIAGQKIKMMVIDFERNHMTLRVPLERAEISGLRPLSSTKKMDEAISSAKGKAASEKDSKTSKPTPNPKEGYLYENFRVFLKWAQELIFNNPEITSLAKIDTVYVNLPDRYRFLLDMANKAMEESDLTFAPLLPEGTEASIVDNLELYGGFFTGRYNEANTF